MTSNLTVFKIITEHEFISNNEYKIIHEKKPYPINCIKSDNVGDAWYFSTEIERDVIFDLFQERYAKIGTLRLSNLDVSFLKFIETRTKSYE